MAKQAYIYDGTQWVPVGSQAVSGTSANTVNQIVQRDGSGNFSAGTITATTVSISGNYQSTNATYPNQLSVLSTSDSVVRPLPFAMSTGTLTGSALAAGTGISATVTFSTASRFTQTPFMINSYFSNGYNAPSAQGIGTTTGSVRAWNPQTTAQTTGTHQWLAIQMTAASTYNS